MIRFFCCFCFVLCSLFARDVLQKPKDSQIGEITADEVRQEKDEIIAKGNVVLISGEYYIASEDLIYNIKTKIAYIEGEARIYQGNDLLVSSKKMKLDFSKDQFSLSSLYLQNNKTGLWITASEAHSDDGVYYFKKGVISGCDIQSPIWHLDVSSGSLDQNKNILTLWNARAYLGKMPFLYIPYLSVSTQNQRKSGLLYPRVAYIDREGFYYEQPIYIAPYESWDMTFSPQIRTARGAGITGEFRIATPKDDLFVFQTKYFYNFFPYTQKYMIKNQHIYGFNLFYSTHNGTGALKKFPTWQDGFLLDLNFLNDIDYLRIDSVGKTITDRMNISKLNYFFRTQDHYLGFYNKYFFDFGSVDNQETMQLLPGVQYHKFLDSLFWKNLTYSFDFQVNNIMRRRGYGYVENSIAIPIGIEFPLFNNYLSIGVSTDLNFTNINLNRANNLIVPSGIRPSKSANFFTANYNASLTSDIAKDYGKFLHTMQLSARVTGPYYRYNTAMFDSSVYKAYAQEAIQTKKIYNVWNPLSIIDFDANKPKLELELAQYFYTPSGKTIFYYDVSQKLNLESKEYLLSSSLQNEVGSSPIDGLNMKGTIYYSFLHSAIEEASANIDFSRWSLKSSFGYYYKQLFLTDGLKVDANFLNFSLKNDFGYFAVGGDINYDFLNNGVKDWKMILSTDVRCFGISLEFGQEFSPMVIDNSNQPIQTIVNNFIKLQFRVIPLGEVSASYKFKR